MEPFKKLLEKYEATKRKVTSKSWENLKDFYNNNLVNPHTPDIFLTDCVIVTWGL